jgi:hypothetical protein
MEAAPGQGHQERTAHIHDSHFLSNDLEKHWRSEMIIVNAYNCLKNNEIICFKYFYIPISYYSAKLS